MHTDYVSKKNFDDFEMGFVFERLHVASPYGEGAKRRLTPFLKVDEANLTRVYDQLEAMITLFDVKHAEVIHLKNTLKGIKYLDLTFERLSKGEVLSVTELFEIKQMVMVMERIKRQMEALHWEKTVKAFSLLSTQAVVTLLDPENSGVQTFHIYAHYSSKLRAIRDALDDLEHKIKQSQMELTHLLKEEGYTFSPGGEVRISVRDTALLNRVQSDVRLAYKSEVPMYRIFTVKIDDTWRKQREKLKHEEEVEELNVRTWLSQRLKEHLSLFSSNTAHIGAIDLLIAKAQFSVAFHCVRPQIISTSDLHIIGGRHLKVAQSLERQGKSFTEIDMGLKHPVTMITGANMGGKTITLKMIGQVVVMAQYGLFVPCESAELPLFDYVFISVGDFQSIDMGLSTFGGEIMEIQQVLKREADFGLLLIDELARGTNPLEGFAISKALIEHLSAGRSRVVITTHYDGLTKGSGVGHYQVNGLSGIDLEAIKEKIATEGAHLLHAYMDYRLTEVSQRTEIPKEAIRISEIMGLNPSIVTRAKALLSTDQE